MTPTEDSFRALARSSPWRWRSLHFTRHSPPLVEAWLRRPSLVRVREQDGQVHSGSVIAPDHEAIYPYPEPARRPDGLVADRPDFPDIDDDDLMWQDYRWIAMLDPAELSVGTFVSDVIAASHRDRPVWQATISPAEGYEPRCGCCSLLASEAVDREEWSGVSGWTPRAAYPTGYRVALDVETAVLVGLEPLDAKDERFGDEIDLQIHDVDADLGDAPAPPPR